jgi:glycosyltransferase involved in cell wall biosynthesis
MAAGPRGTRQPALSVLLPVYEAMPWLPIAVRDILHQRLQDDAPLELIVAYDGGTDNSLSFLIALVEKLGPEFASDEVLECPGASALGNAINPALLQPLRAPEGVDHPSFASASSEQEQPLPTPLDVVDVARASQPMHRLRLVRHADGCNRGQGAAMSLALRHASAPLIAQMESDDERADPQAFRRMMEALDAHPEWDGVSCQMQLVGWPRPGMQAYASWQNGLLSKEAMRNGRFIEIPSLHQTAIFRRTTVETVLSSNDGSYRDGPLRLAYATARVVATEAEAAHEAALDVPVDLWWWLSFFHAGLACGKVDGLPLFGWRQHPRQHTRTHGRLSLENLRRIKVHFLLKGGGGPLEGCTRIVVVSVGSTLRGWAADLGAHPACDGNVEVVGVSWAPGKKGNAPLPPEAHLNYCERSEAVGSKRKLGGEGESKPRTARVWAFGREEVRVKVRACVADFDEMVTDVFVA